jgi:Tol biopolymer transport system component
MFLSVQSAFKPTSDDIQTRISTAADGMEGLGDSNEAQFSPDGRFVVFESDANNLVAGDNNGQRDIFLKDLSTGAIIRLSTTAGGAQADSNSLNVQFSPDGGFVVFTSYATNLITGDTNNATDIFLKDLTTGAVTRLSTTANGTQANGNSSDAQLSQDGHLMVFSSTAANLGGSGSFFPNIFLKDLTTGAVTLVTSAADGTQANGLNSDARFSPDGHSAVFESSANNLVTGDANNQIDIFLKDLSTGAVTLVTNTADGTQGNGRSYDARFSADGHFVMFTSAATNLVAGDTNGASDIFLKDLNTKAVIRLSTAADGTQANGRSYDARFSADGHFVVFTSEASNLVADDTNGVSDVFLKDLTTGAITRLSTAANGAQTDFDSYTPLFSPDGHSVVFESDATNLVAGDGNNRTDLFLVNLFYKANAAAILEGRFIETTLGVGSASSVNIAWGDGTSTTETPVADKVSLHHAFAATGTKDAVVTLIEGALTWNVAHTLDLASGTMVRNTGIADTLSGGAGSDTLTGDAFSNILNGNAGNDRLDGGFGADVMNGGAGDDTYVTDGADMIVEVAGGGIDTVVTGLSFSLAALTEVENLTAADGSTGVMLTGNALANTLTGNAGANGLDGGAGADVLTGGAGDDTYVTDGADIIVEAIGGGTDTIVSRLNFSLTALTQVENLTAADGTARLALTGNGLANALTGNAGVNRLSGGAGNDRLTGGLGQDSLAGGAGRDVFVFDDRDTSASKSKADYILDFSRRQSDRIDLSAIDANTRKRGDQKFSFIGDEKSFSKAGEMRFEKTKSTTYIYLNTDNDRSAEAVIKIKGALDLQKGWFVL